MEIKHKEQAEGGVFYIHSEHKRLGEMTFFWEDKSRINLDHTAVSEDLKGQGAGKQLLAAAVKFAREHKIQIVASCPFAKAILEKTAEYADVYFAPQR